MSKSFNVEAAVTEVKNGVGYSGDDSMRRHYPSFWAIVEGLRDGTLSAASEKTDPPLNVHRTELVRLVTEKRDAVAAPFDVQLEKLATEDANRADYAGALGSYFAAIGSAHTSGEYIFNASTGTLRVKDGGPALPVQPVKPRSEADVQSARERCQADKAAAVAPFEAEITLLAIGSDDAIPVVAASTSALLSREVPSVREY